MPNFKFGKTAARRDAVKLKFSNYLYKPALPSIPKVFGHQGLVAAKGWGMLGNDNYGCCVWAGAAHETMMWNYEAGRRVSFGENGVLSDYTAVTGFDRRKLATDVGTDIETAAKYRRDIGVIDIHGVRHKIAAYLALDAGDLDQHLAAAYLFGAVGVGILVTTGMMDQFDAGKPWDVSAEPSDNQSEGGHYVPMVGFDGNLQTVSYGQLQPMTPKCFARQNDESIAYLTEENLTNGKSPEAFDYATLQADLRAITA
jgi:hypothetical protein